MEDSVALQIDCDVFRPCIQGVGYQLNQKDFGGRDELVTGPEILDYLLPINVRCVLFTGHACPQRSSRIPWYQEAFAELGDRDASNMLGCPKLPASVQCGQPYDMARPTL